MSAFTSNVQHRSFYWQISLLCFVLGGLLAAAARTASSISRAGLVPSRTGFTYGGAEVLTPPRVSEYEAEIKKLRERNSELENNALTGKGAASTLNQELQDLKIFAGLSDVQGPGVIVTLTDSKKPSLLPTDPQSKLIHDSDISMAVNELKAAGAEAISVNNQRIVASTPIRCVGPVIYINRTPTAPPYIISATGPAAVLQQAMNLPNGALDQLRQFDPAMVKVETRTLVHIPAFSGSTATPNTVTANAPTRASAGTVRQR